MKTYFNIINILIGVLVLLLMAIILIKIILKRKMQKGLPAETVEMYPPKNMDPAELGYFLDGRVDVHDMLGLLMYMDYRGYVIWEKKINNNNQTIITIYPKREPLEDSGEAKHIINFYHDLFIRRKKIIINGKKSTNLAKAWENLSTNIEKKYRFHPIFDKKGKIIEKILLWIMRIIFIVTIILMWSSSKMQIYESIFIVLFIGGLSEILLRRLYEIMDIFLKKQATFGTKVMLIILFLIFNLFTTYLALAPYIGVTLEFIKPTIFMALFFLNLLMIKTIVWRNDYYKKLYSQAKGFENFIRLAEEKRIKVLVEDNPNYLFNILPYAYIFGISDKWAKQIHGDFSDKMIDKIMTNELELQGDSKDLSVIIYLGIFVKKILVLIEKQAVTIINYIRERIKEIKLAIGCKMKS